MDKTKYPFNGAAPVRRKTIPTAPADASRSFGNGRDVPGRDPGHYYPPAAPGPLSQFPATGVGETFKGLTLSRDDLEAAKTWEASSAWFGDLLTQTWANDNSKSGLFSKTVGGHQQQQSEPITFPRTITGDELEHYGVAGKGRKAQLRRQFREIHGKKVLSRLSPEYAPEKPDMLEPEGARKREWVMVAKDELRELHEFEAILRREKSLLASQAALTFDRVKMSASDPLPMTKLAVENVCDREMKRSRQEVEKLTKERFEVAAKRERRSIADEQGRAGTTGTRAAAGPLRGSAVVVGTTATRGVVARSEGVTQTSMFAAGSGGGPKASYATLTLDPNRKTRPKRNAINGQGGLGGDGNNNNANGQTTHALNRTGYTEQPPPEQIAVPGPNNFQLKELLRAKLPARSARWMELRRHSEAVAARGERDEMEFEERIQRWADRYTEARERKLDYQWYYVLALRYGPLSQDEFEGGGAASPLRNTAGHHGGRKGKGKGGGARPGMLYLGRCEKGALGVQRRWRAYWPIKKARMYRAAMLFQTLYRKYRMVCRWGPVIRFRVKYGRRKILKSHFRAYYEGVKRQQRVQALIDRHLKGWHDKCLHAWVKFTKQSKEDREQLAVQCLRRIVHRFAFMCFAAWHGYAEQNLRVKRMMARNLNNPCFAVWVEMTLVWREQREVIYLATVLQKFVRGWHGRRRVASIRLLFEKLRWLARGKRARLDTWRLVAERNRKAVDGEVFERQEALASERTEHVLKLRVDLVATTTEAATKLEAAVEKYLKKKGKKELAEMAKARVHEAEKRAELPTWDGTPPPSLEEAKHAVRAERVAAAKAKAKRLAWHNLMAEQQQGGAKAAKQQQPESLKSFVVCPNPRCNHTCPTEAVYLQHTANDPCEGCPPNDRDFAALHLVLLQSPEIGLKRVRRLLERRKGVGQALFALRVWEALEQFRHMKQDDKGYEKTMGDLCDQYLDDETATMKLEDLSLDVKQRCLAEGESCRAHTAAGKKNKKKKASSEKKGMFSGFTKMIGLGGDKHGDPWGDGKRDPQPFMEAQWEAFLIVKRSIDQVEWWNSDLHAKYEEDMEKIRAAEVEAIAADILEKQRQENLQKAKEYKAEAVKREKERAEKSKALEDAALERVCGGLENEVLSDQLWVATHELADRWEALATEAASHVHQELADGAVDMAVEEYILDEITGQWLAQCFDEVTDLILNTAIDNEVDAKVEVERALGHGGAMQLEAKREAPAPEKKKGFGDDSSDDEAEWKPPEAKKSIFDDTDDEEDDEGGEEEGEEQEAEDVDGEGSGDGSSSSSSGKRPALEDGKSGQERPSSAALTVKKPIDETAAAIVIQCASRCFLSRKRLRVELVQCWRKRYDRESGYYYYENVHTGISMWEAPLLFQRLFPQTSW